MINYLLAIILFWCLFVLLGLLVSVYICVSGRKFQFFIWPLKEDCKIWAQRGGGIKRASDCEMSPDMEADAEKRRSRANRGDDTAEEGKSASFYWSIAALFQFQTFFPPHLLLKWHWRPMKPCKSTFSVYMVMSVTVWFYGHLLISFSILPCLSICQHLCLYMAVSLSYHFYDDLDDNDGY